MVEDFIDESARWTTALQIDKIPLDVIESAKILVLDTLASAASSLRSSWGKKLLREMEDLIDSSEMFSLMSVLLDHDSTLLYYGHVGHGAVSTALMWAKEDNDGARVLESIIAGAEVAARIASSLMFSRTRGQMLTIIHSVASAVALSKLRNLHEDEVKRAISFSLSYIIKPTKNGFASQAKAFSASNGVMLGIRSFRLARLGGPAPRGVLESLLREWGGPVLKDPLGGYDHRWHLKTLSVKPWPACSYAQTAISVIRNIISKIGVDVNEIRDLVIEENALTYHMDEAHKGMVQGPRTPFTVLQFYTPFIVSYIINKGDFGREAYELESLGDPNIWKLARRVRRVHNVEFTEKLLMEPLPFGVAIKELGSLKSLIVLLKLLGPSAIKIVTKNPKALSGTPLDKVDLSATRKIVPIRVRIKTKYGTLEEYEELVEGFHGTGLETKKKVSKEKFLNSLDGLLSQDDIDTMYSIIVKLEKAGPDEVQMLKDKFKMVLRGL